MNRHPIIWCLGLSLDFGVMCTVAHICRVVGKGMEKRNDSGLCLCHMIVAPFPLLLARWTE